MATQDHAQLKNLLDNHPSLRSQGLTVLQPYRFGPSDEAHTIYLLSVAEFPTGASVLDIGCGVGGCAALMRELRPDLKFTLLNFSQTQLDECPDGFTKCLADAHALPFASKSFDAVMFNAALGNMDFNRAFLEASRVLKVSGVMLVNEVERVSGDNALMQKTLLYSAISGAEMQRIAESANLSIESYAPIVCSEFLRGIWSENASYDEVFAGTRPGVWRLVKQAGINLDYVLRFKKPALQFSGGKDSLALLHLLKPVLDKITVYNLNTGDSCPETVAVIEDAKTWIPNFVQVQSDVHAWKATNGWPTDLVPARAHAIGLLYNMNPFPLSNRFDCCHQNLMIPMHEAAVRDGVDLFIRGTKQADTGRVPHEGPIEGGAHVWLPIRDWSHDDVFTYLRDVSAMSNPIYDHFKAISAPECLHCTAWWDDGKSRYLKALHPEIFREYQQNLRTIVNTIGSHLNDLKSELEP
jgi:phosphoadenosine phosphosulfate reductase